MAKKKNKPAAKATDRRTSRGKGAAGLRGKGLSGVRTSSSRALATEALMLAPASVARERELYYGAVELDRASRMAEYKTQLQDVQLSATAEAVAKKPVLRLLAEGDSWFKYRIGRTNVIDRLQELIDLPIANMAHAGFEVRQMLALKERSEIRKRLSEDAPDGQPWDAMLFSGGGNDIVGDELCLWLRQYKMGMSAPECIDALRFAAVATIIEAGYRDLIAIRDELSPDTLLFFHQYDFAPPNGKGVCGVGPWLRPSLLFRGIPREIQPDVVKILLSEFAQMQARITAGSKDVVVQTQGTFPDSSRIWWENELHPTEAGFKAIATKFQAALKSRFPQL